MMLKPSRFECIAHDLEQIKSRFIEVTNEIWSLRLRRAAAGLQEGFLSRRLSYLENERRAEFARLSLQLDSILSTHFTRHLFVIETSNDLPLIESITKSMSYIRNSFADTPPVGETIRLLKSAIASRD